MIHRRGSAFLAVLAGAAVLACASAPTPTPRGGSAPTAPGPRPPALAAPRAAPRAEGGGLALSVEPADAEVFVDGRSHGKVADLARSGLPLPPGLYQVSLVRVGYETWRAEVSVRGEVEPIRVTLARAAGGR